MGRFAITEGMMARKTSGIGAVSALCVIHWPALERCAAELARSGSETAPRPVRVPATPDLMLEDCERWDGLS